MKTILGIDAGGTKCSIVLGKCCDDGYQSFAPADIIDKTLFPTETQKGFEFAPEIYKISGRYLGTGLSILIDILNPEIIIKGSIFLRSRDLL